MFMPPMFNFNPDEQNQIERDVERDLAEQPGYLPSNFVMYGSVLVAALWKRIKSNRADAMLRQPVHTPALDDARQAALTTAERRQVALNGDRLPENAS